MAGEHILIVDDEPAIRTALRGVLEDEGYRVTAVASGADALAALADDGHDLVFLDIWMPGMDGLDTLTQIKRLRPEATVVMISGHATIEPVRRQKSYLSLSRRTERDLSIWRRWLQKSGQRCQKISR